MGFWDKVKTAVPKIAKVVDMGVTGGVLTSIAGAVFGSDDEAMTPEKLKEMILGASPEQMAALKRYELDHALELEKIELEYYRLQIESETNQLAETNKTIRVEAESTAKVNGPWWAISYRWPWAYAGALSFMFVSGLLCWLAWRAVVQKEPDALNAIPQLISSFAILFGIPGAILGVGSWWRGKMQASNGKVQQ